MKALLICAASAWAIVYGGTALAAGEKAEQSWDSCRVLVNQYDKIDKSKVEQTIKIRAESLLHKGERLCGRDRYEDGMEALREAIVTVGGKPSI